MKGVVVPMRSRLQPYGVNLLMDHEAKDAQHEDTASVEFNGTLSGDQLEEGNLTDTDVLVSTSRNRSGTPGRRHF